MKRLFSNDVPLIFVLAVSGNELMLNAISGTSSEPCFPLTTLMLCPLAPPNACLQHPSHHKTWSL